MQTKVLSIRPFIGAKDFDLSRIFYLDLGFEEKQIDANLSYFALQQIGFYLQRYYVREWVENTMLFWEVDDAEKQWEELVAMDLPSKYPGVRLIPVKALPWGKECFLHDPSGILWHFGEFSKK